MFQWGEICPFSSIDRDLQCSPGFWPGKWLHLQTQPVQFPGILVVSRKYGRVQDLGGVRFQLRLQHSLSMISVQLHTIVRHPLGGKALTWGPRRFGRVKKNLFFWIFFFPGIFYFLESSNIFTWKKIQSGVFCLKQFWIKWEPWWHARLCFLKCTHMDPFSFEKLANHLPLRFVPKTKMGRLEPIWNIFWAPNPLPPPQNVIFGTKFSNLAFHERAPGRY